MTSDEAKTFLEYVSIGEELYFSYGEKRFFFHAKALKGKEVVTAEIIEISNLEKDPVWTCEGEYKAVLSACINAHIFDGKPFREVFQDIVWEEKGV